MIQKSCGADRCTDRNGICASFFNAVSRLNWKDKINNNTITFTREGDTTLGLFWGSDRWFQKEVHRSAAVARLSTVNAREEFADFRKSTPFIPDFFATTFLLKQKPSDAIRQTLA